VKYYYNSKYLLNSNVIIYSSVDKAEFPTADLLFSCWFWLQSLCYYFQNLDVIF